MHSVVLMQKAIFCNFIITWGVVKEHNDFYQNVFEFATTSLREIKGLKLVFATRMRENMSEEELPNPSP